MVILMTMATGLAMLTADATASADATDWHAAAGPLATRWAAAVTPGDVHAEYPRPQLVRDRWSNLNGLWQYAVTDGVSASAETPPTLWVGRILVPFPIESALSGVMRRVNETERLWYRRTFEVPRDWAGSRLLLHFGAVDWEARVLVNGREAGSHRGGYDGFSLDITDLLRAGGPQEVVVGVWDPTDSWIQPRGKQVRNPEGIFYTPTTGIWQTVWLEPVPADGIESTALVPDPDHGILRLTVAAPSGEVEAVARADGREAGRARGRAGAELVVPVPDPVRWSPDRPFLYDLEVSLLRDGRPVDAVRSYFGMRTVSIGPDAKGVVRLKLNGEAVFMAGPLDQGFWPDGLHTAPSDEALRYDIEAMKRLGFNMARKHVKVEPDRWYYWCDRLGLLVWQDMPSGDAGVGEIPGGVSPSGETPGVASTREITRTPESAAVYERELEAMIRGRWNHPSIVMWVPFNEGWGQFDTVRILNRVKALDPSRLVDGASGWNHFPAGDAIDAHAYPGPGMPPRVGDRARVLGEFGGLGLRVPSHRWAEASWGYEGVKDAGELTSRYEALWAEVRRLRDAEGLSAGVYTQLTDVETECNGILTYDRAVVKLDESRAAASVKSLR